MNCAAIEETPMDDVIDEFYLMDHPDSTEEIPTLDIGDYLAGKPGARECTGRELRHISETIGFFYLAGHGVPQELVDLTFEETKRFHALPLEKKDAIPRAYNAGYLRAGGVVSRNANIVKGTQPNLVSGINRDRPASDPDVIARKPFRLMNNWPQEEDLPDFRKNVLDYYHRIEKLGKNLMPLWAAALDLPADYFEAAFREPHMSLRLAYYPPQKTIGNRQYGIAPHTDNCLMTLLAQTAVPGLAVRMPSGHWRIADIIPGTFLVNTGNLMVRWTNDRFLSTKHRVINTADVDRYSIPLFFGPQPDTLIECLPTCVGPGNPARYAPVTYEDMMLWYFSGTGSNPMIPIAGPNGAAQSLGA
jgi:isopenicillin N synthase-like dioxygenase